MKIVVVNSNGEYCCRPDTTLNHNNSDYYCPDGVTVLKAVPCVYTHIDKAGKCVAEKFVNRYFKSIAFGCLLTDGTSSAKDSEAISMDFTSILDMSWLKPEEKPYFHFGINGKDVYSLDDRDVTKELAAAIVAITRRASLRIGDIVAIELDGNRDVRPGDVIYMKTPSKEVSIKIF